MKQFSFYTALVIFIAFFSTGCDDSDDRSDVCWTSYTTKDGFTSNKASAIASDSMNNIWVGTHGDGLYVFNGREWITYFTMDYSGITCIETDADHIWVGTAEGLLCGDYEHNFSFITTKEGLISNCIQCFTKDNDNNLWVGTDKGVSMFDGNIWKSYTVDDGLLDNSVSSIAADADGNMWFGTFWGVSEFDGTAWYDYLALRRVEGEVYAITFYYVVHSLAVDSQNRKWIGANNGIKIFDGTNWQSYTNNDGLISNEVKAIAFDKSENVWLATGIGISRISGTNWTNYTKRNGLPDYNVVDITTDATGDIWCATPGGVACFQTSEDPGIK